MRTEIIPQIKKISVKLTPMNLSDFCLDTSVTACFNRANEIFKQNNLCGSLPIRYVNDTSIEDEAYKISAQKSEITIFASDKKGLMYGLFTLSELGLVNDGKLNEFEAEDAPSLKLRGLSDDISRGQISTFNNFLEIIKNLARYKYNTYMPYMEDTFKFECNKEWGKYSDGISKDEWKEIIAYANEWGISVRPIVNLLGHFDKLSNIKALQPLALQYEDGRISHVMDPRKPEVRELIIKMLKELVDCFGEGVIHCGGDEPVALTDICGKDEGGKLFIEHYCFIADELKKLNCTLMMYADFFAPPWGDYAIPVDKAKELPENTEFVFWDYAIRESYPFVDALHNQNIKMYISPGTWTWKRFSCDIKESFENTKGLLKQDNGRSLGMIMSSWADGGDTLRELTWPGVLVGGNFCWNPTSNYSFDEFYSIYHKSFFGLSHSEAKKLYNVYHQDRLVVRQNEQEFHDEMWISPFDGVKFKDYEHIDIISFEMEESVKAMLNMNPQRNIDAFNSLYLSAARSHFTAKKIELLPREIPKNIEDGIPYSKQATALANELKLVEDLHRKLWFDCNRKSEWTLCECRYEDLYADLLKFSRNIKLRRMYNMHV